VGDALRSRAIEASGSTSALAWALPTWNRRVEPVQHQPTPMSATAPSEPPGPGAGSVTARPQVQTPYFSCGVLGIGVLAARR
jgi:hypothetical protein